MMFPDGGCRPGYNVQFSTATGSGIIVGVEVTNEGTDQVQLPPMLDQLEERYDAKPEEALVDGGFASLKAIDEAADRECDVYAPLKDAAKQQAAGKDPYAPKPGDSEAVAAWRVRMGTAWARPSTSCVARRQNGSTRSVATAAFGRCRCVAKRNVARWRCCTPSPTT